MHLIHQTRVDACFAEHNRCAVGSIQLKALLQQLGGEVNNALFIPFAHRQQRTATLLHGGVAAELRFGKRFSKGATNAHHFPGRAHLWP